MQRDVADYRGGRRLSIDSGGKDTKGKGNGGNGDWLNVNEIMKTTSTSGGPAVDFTRFSINGLTDRIQH